MTEGVATVTLTGPDPFAPGQEVEVYFNLHQRLFSVRSRKTRKVIFYTDSIELEDVTFKVSEAGRQRVLREKRKNVHAFVRGKLVRSGFESCRCHVQLGSPVFYNPYKYETFLTQEGPIFKAELATLTLTYEDDKAKPKMRAVR